jgi:predicted RNase H-like HicB family nuclease
MTMRITFEVDRESDGRWIAEVVELAGVLAYGDTREQAIEAAKALALRVLAERIEHHELSDVERIDFTLAPAA